MILNIIELLVKIGSKIEKKKINERTNFWWILISMIFWRYNLILLKQIIIRDHFMMFLYIGMYRDDRLVDILKNYKNISLEYRFLTLINIFCESILSNLF